jgi:hypothetical protein
MQESYKSGDVIAVYYNPADPTRSRFTVKEPRIEIIKDFIVVVAYLVGGLVLFGLGRRRLR